MQPNNLPHQSPIVSAIDVGYGGTKYVVRHDHGRPVVCGQFPSIAPTVAGVEDLSSGVFQRRNTVVVEVNGVYYEVGKDAQLAQDASYAPNLTSDYALSDSYLALVRGALFYMNLPRVDKLVVGLPVNTFEALNEKLCSRLTGPHIIPKMNPDGSQSREVREINVSSVHAVPQPIGAFFDYSISSQTYGKLKSEMNLLIDPGYFTLDWVVAHGVKIANARSGAHPGGMSAVLAAIMEAMSNADPRLNGLNSAHLSNLDAAVRLEKNPRFFGREFEIGPYLRVGKEKARQFVTVMANKVGSKGFDIDNIIVAGGGASFFLDVIRETFPHHEVLVTEDPVYANVRGFQLAGEQFATAEAVQLARR